MAIRLSYSAVSTYKACPAKYFHSKVWRPKLQASALPFGSAVESGVTALLEGKTLAQALAVFKLEWAVKPKSRYDEAQPVFDAPKMFYYQSDYDDNLFSVEDKKIIQGWCAQLLNPEKSAEEEFDKAFAAVKNGAALEGNLLKFYHRVIWLSCRRRGIYMIKAFKDQILPKVTKVHSTQKATSIANDAGDTSIGYIDYILEIEGVDGPVIFDCKTAGKYYTSHDLSSSDQLRSYAAAEGLRNIGYLVLLKGISCDRHCDQCGAKRESGRAQKCSACGKGKYTILKPYGETQVLTKSLEEKEVEDVLDDFSDVLTAIENKVKFKNPQSCFNFNKKCEYYDVCWGKKTLEQLKKDDASGK